MKLPSIKIKSPLFISTLILFLVIITVNFVIPRENWKKIFGINNFATAFSTNTSGNWDTPQTWGMDDIVLLTISSSFSFPASIAISSTTDEIYITDSDHNRIVVLKSDGTASTTYDGLGLNEARGIALSPNGEIYIANRKANNIMVLNPDGSFSRNYDGGGILSEPHDLALSPAGDIYVMDTYNNRVVILNPDGTASTTAGPYYGDTYAPMHYPQAITLSPTGDIYIADTDNNRLLVLNPDGTASTTWPVPPYAGYGIIIAPTGQIYLSDTNHSRIVIINSDGIVSSITTGVKPMDIAFNSNGEPYMVDYHNPFGKLITIRTEGVHYPGPVDDVTINIGTVLLIQNQNVYNLTLATGGTLDLGTSTLNIYGHWWNFINTGGTFIPNSGSINFPDTSTDITSDATINSGIVILTQNQSIHNITIDMGGTLDLAGYTLNINGNLTNTGGTLISNGGILHTSTSSNLILDSGATFVLPNNMDFSSITMPSGTTLDLNGHTLNIYGDWIRTSGTFITNGGTVNFVSTSTQTISGNNIFENLTKISTASSSLLFDTVGTTTITGNINLQGSPNNLLSLAIASSSYSYLDTLGSSFWGPAGMVVDGQSNIYWVEQGGRVQKYDSNFNNLLTFTGSFCGPRNIAVDDVSGNIYVSDFCHRIQVFDSLGNKINEIGTFQTSSSTDGQFDTPTGIAFYDGNLYVVDQNNYRIQKFSASGSFISKFVVPAGSGPGQFSSSLNGMAIDSQGNIYVADSGNQRVLKFDSSGIYLSQIGEYGSNPGQFFYPAAISIDSSDNVYVTDLGKNNVQEFTSSGVFMDAFGSVSDTNNPWGVVADSVNHYVYVASSNNYNIVRFYLPQVSNHFNILKTGSGTASFSYLNVTNSNNLSASPFSCLVGCVDGGGNTNWTFTSGVGSGFKSRLASISISPLNFSILVGSTTQFISTTLNQRGNPFNTTVNWSSSNPSVGTVDSNGLFTAVSTGTTIVSASADSISKSTTVTVTADITDLVITPPIIIAGNDTSADNSNNATGSSRITETFCFTKNLSEGIRDNDVKQLQIFLNDNNFNLTTWGPGSYEEETSSYGYLTKQAVIKFQEYYAPDILTPFVLTYGTGIFGNTTRKKANYLLNHSCITVPEYASTSPKEIATTTKEIATTTPKKVIPEIVLSKPTSTTPVVPQEVKPTPISQPKIKPTTVKPAQQFDITQIFDKQLVLGIMDNISQSYKDVMSVSQIYIDKLKNLVKDSRISITTKIVTTIALVFGVVASISTVAFATPVSFSEIWLIPARVWGLILGALGIRRKQRQWGTVYDSVTKRPLDPVYVSLVNTETGKEVAGAITDIDGRYGFLVLPGKYKIVATKTNYIQPSVKMSGKSFDEVYNDLYFGEELVIAEGQIITKNIPMDSLSFDWNEFAKTKMNVNKFMKQKDITWARISKFIFVIGALISIVAVVAAPQPYNYIIAGFYVVAYVLNFIVFRTKKSGTIVEKSTKAPLSFAIIKIFREGEDTPLTKKIADKFGAYYALLPNGKYYMKVEKKNDDGTYTEVFQSSILDITKGVINFNLSL